MKFKKLSRILKETNDNLYNELQEFIKSIDSALQFLDYDPHPSIWCTDEIIRNPFNCILLDSYEYDDGIKFMFVHLDYEDLDSELFIDIKDDWEMMTPEEIAQDIIAESMRLRHKEKSDQIELLLDILDELKYEDEDESYKK